MQQGFRTMTTNSMVGTIDPNQQHMHQQFQAASARGYVHHAGGMMMMGRVGGHFQNHGGGYGSQHMMHHPQQQQSAAPASACVQGSYDFQQQMQQQQNHFGGGGMMLDGAADDPRAYQQQHHRLLAQQQQLQQQNQHPHHVPAAMVAQQSYINHFNAGETLVLPAQQQQQQQQQLLNGGVGVGSSSSSSVVPLTVRNHNAIPPTSAAVAAASSSSSSSSSSLLMQQQQQQQMMMMNPHQTHQQQQQNKLCVNQLTRWRTLEKLGAGTYGVVFRCEDTVTGQSVAMKRIAEQGADQGVPSIAIREISLLREVQHPNVVSLLNVVPRDRELVLIFEYVDQDLKKLLDSRVTPFQGRKLKWIMYQLLQGIFACHARRVVHRDLKPQNILVSKNEGVVKIADMGLSRSFHVTSQTYTREVVTLWYRAPEILMGERHYRPTVDMWSLGCIMAELATKKALFPGDCEIHQLFLIFRVFGTPTEESWPGVTSMPQFNTQYPRWAPNDLRNFFPTMDDDGLDLLRGLLRVDPLERISAAEALRHRWFDSIREQYALQFSDYR